MSKPLSEVDNLIELVSRAAQLWPDRTAWIFDETKEQLTFTELDYRSSHLALALKGLGVESGDRVAVMLRNEPYFPLLWLALAKLTAILVPLNVNYRETDGEHILRSSGAKFVLCGAEFVELLEKIAPRTEIERVLTVAELMTEFDPESSIGFFWTEGERPVNIQYTSGTTGSPKGCILPHRYWTNLAESLVTEFPRLSEQDIILTSQPFYYIDPQWNVAAGLASGATLVVLDRFHPSTFWAKVKEYRVTWFYCLGLMPTLLLRTPKSDDDQGHHVRAIYASTIPREIHAALEERWGVPWYEAFGMTETGADIRMSPQDQEELVGSGCIGRPIETREAIIADSDSQPLPRGAVGELLLRGIGLMHGYYHDPAATAEAFAGGWFHTGDLAKMDAQGRIFYLGRTKDMIRRSGENISAGEVEQVLLTHPSVQLAAVIAVPDQLRGEEVKAYVVLEPGQNNENISPENLAAFCAERIAYFKVPRYWAYVDSLPLTASARIAKGELRKIPNPVANVYDHAQHQWR